MNFIIWFKWVFILHFLRSYYEANDVMSAINIIEEAFAKHQGLVSKEDINIAAELFISNKQYDKALEVRTRFCIPELSKVNILIYVYCLMP